MYCAHRQAFTCCTTTHQMISVLVPSRVSVEYHARCKFQWCLCGTCFKFNNQISSPRLNVVILKGWNALRSYFTCRKELVYNKFHKGAKMGEILSSCEFFRGHQYYKDVKCPMHILQLSVSFIDMSEINEMFFKMPQDILRRDVLRHVQRYLSIRW